MSRVVWTPQAIADVESIHDHIFRDSPRYATLVVEQIVESVERLAAFPRCGRVVPERNDDALRELLWGHYRIVYRVARDRVEVVTVFHGARIRGIPWEVREVRKAS